MQVKALIPFAKHWKVKAEEEEAFIFNIFVV